MSEDGGSPRPEPTGMEVDRVSTSRPSVCTPTGNHFELLNLELLKFCRNRAGIY